jgi:hypothetical protein
MKWWRVYILIAACLAVPVAAPHSVRDPGKFGGTFIGVVVAEDGIIVGSDSRSTFIDGAGQPVGYVDGMTKIYVSEGAAVAVAGLTSVEDELFSSFMRRNEDLLDKPVNEILFDVALKLPFRNTTNVVMLSAGFVKGEPRICAKAPNQEQTCRKAGYFTNKNSSGLLRWFEGRGGRSVPAGEAAAALGRAILEAADLDSTIGGPITLLQLSKSGTSQWLQNPPDDDGWRRVCDVVGSYRRGKTPIFFTDTKDRLDRYLDGVCPK